MTGQAYAVRFDAPAAKQVGKLDKPVQRRVLDKAHDLAKDPRPPGCVQIKDAVDLWRVRVGDYRIVYTIRDGELLVLVLSVAHRGEVYRNL